MTDQDMTKERKNTIAYYDEHAAEFVENTRDAVFTDIQENFVRYMPKGGKILDFGCGSGRDTKYFLDAGFQVEAIDGSREMCKLASKYTGIDVLCMDFTDFSAPMHFEGIWACASLLHLGREELEKVFGKLYEALKLNGLLYASFKLGTFEGEKNGRYFTYMEEESVKELLEKYPGFLVESLWVSRDVRPGRENESWINFMLRKKMEL